MKITLKDEDFYKVDGALYPLPVGVIVRSDGWARPIEIDCLDNKEFFNTLVDLLQGEAIIPIEVQWS